MSGQKAIEVTTQALTAAATEVKGVDHDANLKCQEEINERNPTKNTLSGSTLFDKKEKE